LAGEEWGRALSKLTDFTATGMLQNRSQPCNGTDPAGNLGQDRVRVGTGVKVKVRVSITTTANK